jgi:hypothetical protein
MMHVGATSMNDDDQILRAYAAITSIRANVPERHEIEARWVNEFNAAIEKLEKSLGIACRNSRVRKTRSNDLSLRATA